VPGYEVLGELGRGGMAVVYKARQVALNRVVALKMVLAGGHAGEQDRARFRAEAEAIARLQHPGIVQVHDVGEHEGRPFFSLEYCPGGTLADRLGGRPLPPRDAAALVEALARAVHYAHQRGVVHRDLKPSNVLLTLSREPEASAGVAPALASGSRLNEAVPKIADFGLAKTLDSDSGRTRTGAVLGTPSYMAPEQAAGKTRELGPAVDVYALGAILYECLTGRPPFQGPTPLDTLAQVLHDEPAAPRALQPSCPRDLETVCLRCLEKEPRRRYASAADLADDLKRFLAGEPITARPARALERAWKWAKRRPAVAGLLTALAAVVVGAFVAVTAAFVADDEQRREAVAKTRELERTSAELSRARTQAEADASASNIALAGQLVRDNDVGAARRALDRCPPALRRWEWHHLTAQCRAARLAVDPGVAAVSHLVVSPDGKTLAAVSVLGQLLLLDAATGAVRLRLKDELPTRGALPAFSADGRALAVVRGPDPLRLDSLLTTVLVLDAATGRELCRRSALIYPECVGFRADGALLVAGFAWGDKGGVDLGKVEVWDLDAGVRVAALPGFDPPTPGLATGMAFAPGCRRLAGWAFDVGFFAGPKHDEAAKPAELKQENHPLEREGNREPVRPDVGPDGKPIRPAPRRLRVWDLAKGGDGTVQQFAAGPSAHTDQAAFSPDGTRLAFSDAGVVWDWRLGDGVGHPLRGHLGDAHGVAYSPDGTRLASAGADRAVRVWDVATHAELFTLRGHDAPALGVAYSPDGARLYSCGGDLFVINSEVRAWAADGPPEVHTWRGDAAGPAGLSAVFALAPAAGRFALYEGRPGAGEGRGEAVTVRDLATGRRLCELADGGRGVTPLGAFSPDGRRLAVLCRTDAVVYDAADGRRVAEVPLAQEKACLPALAFLADGRLAVVDFAAPPEAARPGRRLRVRLADASTGRVDADFTVEAFAGVPPPGKQEMPVVNAVAVHPDGRLALVASLLIGDDEGARFRGEVVVCDPSGQTLWRHGVEEMLLAAAFAADGSRLAVGGGRTTSGRLLVFAADGGAPLADVRGHGQEIDGLAVSADGARVATVSGDRAVRLWDAAGRELLTLTGHGRGVTVAAFAPDGRLLTGTGATLLSLFAVGEISSDLRAPPEVKAWAGAP
jgi:WD40 repeat protein